MSEKRNTLTVVLAILLLLLGAGLGYSLYELRKLKNDYNTLLNKSNTVEELYAELEDEYDRSLSQLEGLEGENASLDSLVEAKKTELKEAKSYIASLLADKNATAGQLADARRLIAQLTDQRIALQHAVDSLQAQNVELERDKITLLQEKEVITASLEEATQTATVLESENENLKKEKALASILTADNMIAQGIKVKNNGKEVITRKSGAVNKLKLCFDLLENKIAPKGPTDMQVRIIAPDGTTLTLDAMGSGTFTDAGTGSPVQYTYEIAPDFNSEGKSVCSYWDQNTAYAPGTYQAMLYQNGYRIGATSFELR